MLIPPMGYFKDKNTNEVEIVEEAAEIIRTIFKLYLEGYGLKAIARILNESVKKWAAGKSTTEKRLENLRNSIIETELEIQKILMERIEDKQNSDMYDKMIETRRDDIEKFKKEISEIENLDKTIRERKSTLKHSIELLDDIIAENNISNANLHLMFDKIVIEETDEGLNIDLRLKSPFISKKKEPLLKKYMIVDNEVLSVGA